VSLVNVSREMARDLLAESLPRRWQHVCAVASRAVAGTVLLPAGDRELLVAAAWLHDIGYAPDLAVLGFHPLDGARWLLAAGVEVRLAALVAYHSCASVEADELGLLATLTAEFRREESAVADVLWWADMTTSPDGQPVDVQQRLAEIHDRYGPDHAVTRTWIKAGSEIEAVVGRVEKALASR
jgi:hypothetical protein